MNRIAELRRKQGMTQKDLALKLKFSESTIANYENERTNPDIETIRTIAKYFQVTTDYLLGNSSIPFDIDYSSMQTESGKLRSNISSKLVHLSEEDLRALSHIVDKMLNK